MGSAGDYIRKIAREAAQTAFQVFVSNSTQIPGEDPNWFMGKVSPDRSFIEHPNGEVFDLLHTGIVAEYNMAYKVTDTLAFAIGNPKPPQLNTDGGFKVWAILGVVTNQSNVPNSFPVFNLFNYSTLAQYKIPQSLLPNLFEVQPYNSTNFAGDTSITDLGYNGNFYAFITPNSKKLVFVRIRSSYQTPTVSIPHFSTETLHISWNVVNSYTLNNINMTIESDDVVGGSSNYTYNMSSTGFVPTYIPTSPGSPYTFSGWQNWFFTNYLEAAPYIWIDSNNSIHLDFFGYYASQRIDNSVWSPSQPFSSGFYTADEGGLFKIDNILDSGTLTSTGFLGVMASANSTFSPFSSLIDVASTDQGFIFVAQGNSTEMRVPNNKNNVIRHTNNVLGVPSSNKAKAGFAYRDLGGSLALGLRSRFSSSGYSLCLINPNSLSIVTEKSSVDTFTTDYILDGISTYPLSNSTTGWQALYNTNPISRGLIKTVGTRKFNELKVNSDLTGTEVQRWRYENNIISPNYNTMQPSGKVKLKSSNTPLTILDGNSVIVDNSPAPILVMDFTVI